MIYVIGNAGCPLYFYPESSLILSVMGTASKNLRENTAAFNGWEQMYLLSNHWKSVLEFFRDDLRFLHHLMDRHILWVTQPESSESVKEVESKLLSLKKQCRQLLKKTGRHTSLLSRLLEKSPEADQQAVKDVHAQLETEFALFVKNFRAIRKETFKLSEYIIDSESLTNIR